MPGSKRQQRMLKKENEDKSKRTVALGIYLIVCEGEKTEPNYFNFYKNELERLKKAHNQIRNKDNIFIKTAKISDDVEVKGEGYNTESLVNHTINLKK